MTEKAEPKQEPDRPGLHRDDDDVEIVSVAAVDEDGRPLSEGETEDGTTPVPPPEAAAPVEVHLDEDADLREMRERWLRALADLENYRRRVERDRELTEHQALERVVTELLPVLDDFDRALTAGFADGDGLRAGMELIARSLHEVLGRFGVEALDTDGAMFDPNLHEAGAIETTTEIPPQTIVGEIRRGYLLGDRLLRPALVRVAVPPPEEEGP